MTKKVENENENKNEDEKGFYHLIPRGVGFVPPNAPSRRKKVSCKDADATGKAKEWRDELLKTPRRILATLVVSKARRFRLTFRKKGEIIENHGGEEVMPVFGKKDKTSTVMYRGYRIQIFPDAVQKELIKKTFGCVRKVYNDCLSLQRGLYECGMGRMSAFDLNNYYNKFVKKQDVYLTEVDKFAITNAIYSQDEAFSRFFAGKSAYPRFKSGKDTVQSYTTNVTGNNIAVYVPENAKDHHGRVKLPRLGWVDACTYRPLPKNSRIKSAAVSITATGKYYVSVRLEITVNPPEKVMPRQDTTLGLDYSSPYFCVDSNGETPEGTHFFRRSEEKLVLEQHKLSRMQKGSQNYLCQCARIARIHEHIVNQRRNFCHTQSRKITNSCDAVCVEDINLCSMAQSLQLGKSTGDNGFGMFREFLRYKLEEQGKSLIVIDKWYPSTKTCYQCGKKNPKVKLNDRVWTCPHCGRLIQRDHNAALNIRDEGLRVFYSTSANFC